MTDEKFSSIKEQILEKIKERKITPHSRAYFVFISVIFMLVFVLVLITLILATSFVIQMMRENGSLYLAEYGLHGLRLLLASLPWFIITLALALFFVLQFTARKFRFAYRRPILITLFGLALLTLLCSMVFAGTRVHRRALELAEKKDLPVFGSVYRYYGIRPRHNFLIGTLEAKDNNKLKIITRDGHFRVISISSSTRLGGTNPIIGDTVFILGEEKGGSFSALGLRLLREDEVFIPPHIKSRFPPPSR